MRRARKRVSHRVLSPLFTIKGYDLFLAKMGFISRLKQKITLSGFPIPICHSYQSYCGVLFSPDVPQEKLERSTGRATVEYNRNKVLEGKYNCLSESWAGFDKDTIHVELENKFLPIGADYVHGYAYSGQARAGSNKPTMVRCIK